MKQASLTLLGIPDSVHMNAQTKIFTANFGTLCVQLPGLAVTPETTTALEIKASLIQGVWTATEFDIFHSGNQNTDKSHRSTSTTSVMPEISADPVCQVVPGPFSKDENNSIHDPIAKQIESASTELRKDENEKITEQKTPTYSVTEPVTNQKTEPIQKPSVASLSNISHLTTENDNKNVKNISKFPSRDTASKYTPNFSSASKSNIYSSTSVNHVKNTGIDIGAEMNKSDSESTTFKPSIHNAKTEQNTARKTTPITQSNRPQFNINSDQDLDIPF